MGTESGNHRRNGRNGGVRWAITEVASTGSTNGDLVRAAAAGARDGTVLRAEHQTAGRGRLDRLWEAKPGLNLLLSVLFRGRGMSPQRLVQIVALAAREAILDLTGLEVGLKWPNDLVVDSRKLAGVLAEGAGPGCVVVGIGLNIGWAPEGATGIVALTGRTDVTPHSMMISLLDRLDLLVDDSNEDVHRRWVSALETLGRRVSVSMPDGRTIVGTAERVDPDGRLVVRDSDSTDHVIDAGDVVHLRSDA